MICNNLHLEFTVRQSILVLSAATSIRSPQHDYLNMSWTKMILDMIEWTGQRPQSHNITQRTTDEKNSKSRRKKPFPEKWHTKWADPKTYIQVTIHRLSRLCLEIHSCMCACVRACTRARVCVYIYIHAKKI